jgi:hypothetical protein
MSLFHLTTGTSPGGRSLWIGPRMKLDITVEGGYQEGISTSEESLPYDRLAVLVNAASSAEREYSERQQGPTASSTFDGGRKEGDEEDEQEEEEEENDDEQEQGQGRQEVEEGKQTGKLIKKNIFKERMSAADMVSKYENYANSQLLKVRYINNAHERKVATNWVGTKRAAEPSKDDSITSADDDNEGGATLSTTVVEDSVEQKIDQIENVPANTVIDDANPSGTIIASLLPTSSSTSKRAGKIKAPPAAEPVPPPPPPPPILLAEVPPVIPSDVSPADPIEVPVEQSTSAKRKRGRPTLAAVAAAAAAAAAAATNAAAAAVADASSPPSPRPSTTAATSTEGGKKGKKAKKIAVENTVDSQPLTESDSINNWRLHFLACLSTRQE